MSDGKVIAVVGATGSQGGGLARAILDHPEGGFTVRALTRNPDSDAAHALAERGADVVAADLDDEASLVTAFAVFCITTFTQLASAATLVLGFYFLARSITAIQLMSQSTIVDTGPTADYAALLADAIAMVLPRLDAFAQTAWLIGAPASPLTMSGASVQTAIYIALLLAAAMFDLHRRNL